MKMQLFRKPRILMPMISVFYVLFMQKFCVYFQENASYTPEKCSAFHCDITEDDVSSHVEGLSVDVATLIFVLSAIHPDKMAAGLHKIFQVGI